MENLPENPHIEWLQTSGSAPRQIGENWFESCVDSGVAALQEE